jgi:EthD domain
MIKMVVELQRQVHLTRPQFLTYWSDVHAPLVTELSEVLGIRRYVQCYPVSQEGGGHDSGVRDCDGFAEVWFESREPKLAGRDDLAYRTAVKRLRLDEDNFMDRARSTVWWLTERTIL